MSILKFLKKFNPKQQDDSNATLSNDSLGGEGMGVRPSSAPDRDTYKQTVTPPVQGVSPQQEPPMDTSVRPRIVGDSMGVPPPSDTQETQNRINHIQTKDYSLEKDPNGNVIHRGADRDANWSLKDKIGSTLLGILDGAGRGPIGMLQGGINAGTDRDYVEKRDDAKEMQRLVPRLGQQQQADKYEQDRKLEQAKIDDIPADNVLRGQQIDNEKNLAADRLKSNARSALAKLKHFDPTNAAHASLAQQAGLDPEEMKGWDDRNPYTKTVAGTVYEYDKGTGEFKASDIPVDESKASTPYEVTLPNGEKRTYQVPQKDAARFAQQMNVVGAQIASREKLKGDQIAASKSIAAGHDATKVALDAERKKHGDEVVKQNAVNAFKKMYYQKKKKNPSQQEIDDYVNNVVPAPEPAAQ